MVSKEFWWLSWPWHMHKNFSTQQFADRVFVFKHFRSLYLYCAICRSCMIMWKMILLQFSGQTMDINACRFCDWVHKDKPQNYGQTQTPKKRQSKIKKKWTKEKLKGNSSKKRTVSSAHIHKYSEQMKVFW